MNNIDQMIEVLSAYKRGEKIEYRNLYSQEESWKEKHIPVFNFESYIYRIAKPAPKKVKMLCWYDGFALLWLAEKHPSEQDTWIRVPSEDKEITLP